MPRKWTLANWHAGIRSDSVFAILDQVEAERVLEAKERPKDNGTLFEYCIHANICTAFEAWFFACTYGFITGVSKAGARAAKQHLNIGFYPHTHTHTHTHTAVMTCNRIVPSLLPDEWGWCLVVWLTFLTMNWMCAFGEQ